ncbi:GNAT family N-acetyltransferase [Fictibacillus terranigra]|uniref:GNAT family N-acetyltransferase n=1 Tax=Fictibacillus terranigra TaxID=3058424 RepID=A0ABT8E2J8_9BACL|nr:GNAT family N-acetyltransferase [Fictibacillus sp. CENA-BCM004]MDN4072117.1 GNAT family N-acetyltransferase [Fictibacillus sp. CENA-BCM004]
MGRGYTVETQRLRFRQYTMDDLEFYASLWGQPDVVRYIGRGLTKTNKEAWKSLENWILPGYKNGLGLYVIQLKETEEPIGHAGLVRQVVEGRKETEIGYWLAKPYWGQGFASEAAAFFTSYGKNQLKYGRLISLIHPKNAASIAVAKKLGMAYEKTVFFNGNRTRVYASGE